MDIRLLRQLLLTMTAVTVFTAVPGGICAEDTDDWGNVSDEETLIAKDPVEDWGNIDDDQTILATEPDEESWEGINEEKLLAGDKKSAARSYEPTEEDGWTYQVKQLVLEYLWDPSAGPEVANVMDAEVELMHTDKGWVAAREGMPSQRIQLREIQNLDDQRFFTSALQKVAEKVVAGVHEQGVAGVYVTPAPEQISEYGEDLREEHDQTLRLQVEVPTIAEVHTVARSKVVGPDERVNNSRYEKIAANSPTAVGGLIISQDIEDYVHRLNRHPGRNVEVAVASYKEPEYGRHVALDYVITEEKPWVVFFHVANTGSEGTNEWRETFGYRNCQLTCSDDILNLSYVTASFDEFHLFTGDYERPFCIFGWDTRWKTGGSFHQFTSEDLGIFDTSFEGDGWSVFLETRLCVYQYCDWFVDFVKGVRFQNYGVDTLVAGVVTQTADADFLIGYFGFEIDRCCCDSKIRLGAYFEGNLDSLVDTNLQDLQQLGRSKVKADFWIFKWDAYYSTYLDCWLCSESACGGYCHNLEFAFRGQTSMGDRLPPQYQQTVGGMYTVRGYEQALGAGDTVVLASAEYRLHLPCFFGFAPGVSNFQYECDRECRKHYGCDQDCCYWDIILSTYLDYGTAHNYDKFSYERDESLLGTGLGLELIWDRNLTFRADWSVALRDAGVGGGITKSGDSRAHISLAVMY